MSLARLMAFPQGGGGCGSGLVVMVDGCRSSGDGSYSSRCNGDDRSDYSDIDGCYSVYVLDSAIYLVKNYW